MKKTKYEEKTAEEWQQIIAEDKNKIEKLIESRNKIESKLKEAEEERLKNAQELSKLRIIEEEYSKILLKLRETDEEHSKITNEYEKLLFERHNLDNDICETEKHLQSCMYMKAKTESEQRKEKQ